jgi:UDP-glucose 4-epimerase
MPARALADSQVLLLGANGFIGRNLSLRLSGSVGELRGFGRAPRSGALTQSTIDWVEGDIADTASIEPLIRQSDVVFHLVDSSNPGSSSQESGPRSEDILKSTARILDACVSSRVDRFVFLSSGGSLYGNTENIPTPETSPTNPISPYGQKKLAIEELLAAYRLDHGLDYVAIRASNPYGAYQVGKNKQGLIGSALIAGLDRRPFEIWGDGTVVRDFVYIDDLVAGIVQATVSGSMFREFNLGSGEGLSVNEVLDVCDEFLEHPLERIYKEGRSQDVQKSILDISRAQSELDWKPNVSLQQGIARTKFWLENNTPLWS